MHRKLVPQILAGLLLLSSCMTAATPIQPSEPPPVVDKPAEPQPGSRDYVDNLLRKACSDGTKTLYLEQGDGIYLVVPCDEILNHDPDTDEVGAVDEFKKECLVFPREGHRQRDCIAQSV